MQQTVCAADNPVFNQAVVDYNRSNYFSAIHGFRQVVADDSRNGLAHYYLGNAYVKIEEMEKAASEYQSCLSAGTDPTTAGYCRQALQAMSGRIKLKPTAAPLPTIAGAGISTTPLIKNNSASPHRSGVTYVGSSPLVKNNVAPPRLAGTDSVIPLPNGFQPELSEEAKRIIKEQTEREMERLKQRGDVLSTNSLRDSKQAADRVREEGKAIVAARANEYEMDINGRSSHKKYSEAQLDQMRRYYESQAKAVEEKGKRESDSAAAHYGHRQAMINETADSLTSQLSKTPGLADSTAIEPLGTNLYVRNYQPISRLLDARPPVRPQLARTASAPGVKPETASADSAVEPKSAKELCGQPGSSLSGASSKRSLVQTKVHGELLH